MKNSQRTEIHYIEKFSPWMEKAGLTLLLVTAIMMLLKMPAQEVLMLSLSTLAIVFFLNVRKVSDVELTKDAPMGLKELLSYLILPKVMWIGASVATIGILFYFLGFKGYDQMLLIGAGTLVIATLLLAGFFAAGVEHLSSIYKAILLRVLPVMIIALYIVFNTPQR